MQKAVKNTLALAISTTALSLALSTPVLANSHMQGMHSGNGSMSNMGENGMQANGGMNMGAMADMGNGFMVQYRFMDMRMDGNRDGNDNLTTSEVTSQGYMMASPEMKMQMHMLMGMYRFSPSLSAMVMLNYLDKSMEMVNASGVKQPTMEAKGLGDTLVGARFTPMGSPLTYTLSLSLPTGSIDKTDLMMGNPDATLPYPMQLGSGTYDLKPGVEYKRTSGAWQLGAKAEATLRLGENDADYTLGNRIDAEVSAARPLAAGLKVKGALNYANWGNIDGKDGRIATTSPYADPNLQAGERLDAGLTLAYNITPMAAIELSYSAPVYQYLDGPQMRVERTLGLNLRAMF